METSCLRGVGLAPSEDLSSAEVAVVVALQCQAKKNLQAMLGTSYRHAGGTEECSKAEGIGSEWSCLNGRDLVPVHTKLGLQEVEK